MEFVLCVRYLLFALSAIQCSAGDPCPRLNDFVHCYWRVDRFDWKEFGTSPQSRRILMKFRAFDMDFESVLRQTRNSDRIWSQGAKVNIAGRLTDSAGFNYPSEESVLEVDGRLTSMNSNVRGVISKDVFNGFIETETEFFYLEMMNSFHRNETGVVIYRESDIIQLKIDSLPQQIDKEKVQKPSAAYLRLNYTSEKYQKRRRKRTPSFSPIRRYCKVHAMVDHTFFQHRAASSTDQTISLLIVHFQLSTQIFRSTDFNNDGEGDNIAFQITELTIFQQDSDPNYVFTDDMGVDTYLDMFSTYDFNNFCMGVIFTHRDFDDGVIGLAWRASSSPYGGAGGICQERIYYEFPQYNEVYFSFNTMLVSTINFDRTLTTAVSSLTLTHEFGHAFGSYHDSDNCAPGGTQGNYIMYPYASNADQPNNVVFSTCSRNTINPVIVNKGGCMDSFSSGDSICGDGFIDDGEQCDCGDVVQCKLVSYCCTPPGPNGCQYNPDYACNPDVSECCNSSCQIKPAGIVCLEGNECREESTCNGVDMHCPETQMKPNYTLCNNGESFCYDGKCTENLCLLEGLETCQCNGFPDTHCNLCCMCNLTCMPAYYLGLRSPKGSVVHLKRGDTCANMGYCNEQHICEYVDADSAIQRLYALFSKQSAQITLEWFQNYWYLLVSAICFMSLMLAIFKAQVTRQKSDPVNTLAIQSGKMAVVWQRAEEEKRKLSLCEQQLEQSFIDTVKRIDQAKLDSVSAMRRMGTFFPTVPSDEIVKAVNMNASEEFAVQVLLLKGYPMKKIASEDTVPSEETTSL